jgi:hypothetical protein
MGLLDIFSNAATSANEVTVAVGDTAKLLPYVVGGLAVCVGIAVILYGTSYIS